MKAPIVIDGNIFTALGLAYREFSIVIGRKLNLDYYEGWFSGINKLFKPEDYMFYTNVDSNRLVYLNMLIKLKKT